MTDYKVLLGFLSAILVFVGYFFYFRDIFKGSTKPHAFTWFAWGLINSIVFFAQVYEGAAAGSWMTGLNALGCIAVCVISFSKGIKDFPLFDWISLFASLFALVLWWLTKEPAFSVILLTLTDILAFLPTFRKGFFKPYEETVSTFAISSFQFFLSIFALGTYNIPTTLYPASIFLTDGLFVLMLLVRRKQLMIKVSS